MSKTQLADLLALSVAERIRIAQAIWDSIAAVPEELPLTDQERKELDRRLDAHYRDPSDGSPWSEVRKRLQGRGYRMRSASVPRPSETWPRPISGTRRS